MNYEEFHRWSINDPEGFWGEQAKLIHWHKPPQKVRDYSNPPFCKWFVGGETNLCYNAVDRHLADRADQQALIYISTETDETVIYTYAELHREVNRFAAVLQSLGVGKGDRVIIYMPMIAEAAFAMLACARLGAVHSASRLRAWLLGIAHRVFLEQCRHRLQDLADVRQLIHLPAILLAEVFQIIFSTGILYRMPVLF